MADSVDIEVWMLKANALACSVAAKDADHENAIAVANWLIKELPNVQAVLEDLRQWEGHYCTAENS